jgi:hypothetical protein
LDEKELISIDDASKEVNVAVQRLALLHLSYSKTLVEEFGEEKGKQLILNAMKEYGLRIAKRTKQGLQSLPRFGFHQRHAEEGTYGCELGLLCQEYGEEDLGRLYCYVDPAKSMGANPETKMIHKKCILCGDEYCAFDIVPTTEEEREDFFGENKDWSYIDTILDEPR